MEHGDGCRVSGALFATPGIGEEDTEDGLRRRGLHGLERRECTLFAGASTYQNAVPRATEPSLVFLLSPSMSIASGDEEPVSLAAAASPTRHEACWVKTKLDTAGFESHVPFKLG